MSEFASLRVIEGTSFDKQTIEIDGIRFERCSFTGCKLIYRGKKQARLSSCFVGPGTVWELRDDAGAVVQSLRDLEWEIIPPGGDASRNQPG